MSHERFACVWHHLHIDGGRHFAWRALLRRTLPKRHRNEHVKDVVRRTDLGNEPMPMTPADFGKLIAEETEKWGKVIRAANIKPE